MSGRYLSGGLQRWRLLLLEGLPGLPRLGKLRLPKLRGLLLERLLLLLRRLLGRLAVVGRPLHRLLVHCGGGARERPWLGIRHGLRLTRHPRIVACQDPSRLT